MMRPPSVAGILGTDLCGEAYRALVLGGAPSCQPTCVNREVFKAGNYFHLRALRAGKVEYDAYQEGTAHRGESQTASSCFLPCFFTPQCLTPSSTLSTPSHITIYLQTGHQNFSEFFWSGPQHTVRWLCSPRHPTGPTPTAMRAANTLTGGIPCHTFLLTFCVRFLSRPVSHPPTHARQPP
ncbi:hypothetical protein B0T18DRAFT_420602 [Schizothecium vesticola]|uniref:Uncharacterized protein n=1 Tax=Schizothecium vesticola TaxID=314040 RepID=A0AA40BP24_9PEZI|nr:hypothetical protein B0T18DRAFT_420602 [Schizothecium vesticola]